MKCKITKNLEAKVWVLSESVKLVVDTSKNLEFL